MTPPGHPPPGPAGVRPCPVPAGAPCAISDPVPINLPPQKPTKLLNNINSLGRLAAAESPPAPRPASNKVFYNNKVMRRQALNEEGELIAAGSLTLDPGLRSSRPLLGMLPPKIIPSGSVLGFSQLCRAIFLFIFFFPGKAIKNSLRGSAKRRATRN